LFALLACREQTPTAAAPELAAEIDSLVARYQDLDIFSGVVMVARNGAPVYHKAFGLANRETGQANSTDTYFDIGSMNKTFTKVVVHQLMAAGQLAVEDTLGKFLDGFAPEKAGRITVGQLLEHRSGFGDYHSPDYFEGPASSRTIAGVVERARHLPLLFEPGSDQAYSNTGYVLLGAIVEKVTGKDYYQNVRERIVEPLQLKHTVLKAVETAPDRSVGYFKTATGQLRDNREFNQLPKPDGGFLSTTSDILRFYQAFHYSDKLLSAGEKKAMPYFQFFEKITQKDGAAASQAGGFNGANTVLLEIPSRKTTVIVFANMDEPVAELLGEGILQLLRGERPDAPQLPAAQNVYRAWEAHGPDFVKENFDSLTVNFHPNDPKDFILNSVGYDLMFAGRLAEAIEIFRLNVALFPDAANCYDSLGEAYLQSGDKKAALANYGKALDLDPDLPSAREAVARLRENR
ncbi:MAG: serine hydrolase, partial [Calditrichaeota bacterium]|nr:serine hydrolase [Calditrichota bacterium]